jgi:hypothetical protein
MSDKGTHVWSVLLRRGDPKNPSIVKNVPAEFKGLQVEVSYTSTRPQMIKVKTNDPIYAVLESSSRGRVINSNRGSAGFISTNGTATSTHHLVDGGPGNVSDVFNAGGDLIANTVRTNPRSDTAVIQFVVPVEPTRGSYRPPICGENVRKPRSYQSNPSVGIVKRVTRNSVRIVGVDHAHSGDSGQLWVAESDGAAVAVHLEGHDLSQGSAKGAPINQSTFPGLGPPL